MAYMESIAVSTTDAAPRVVRLLRQYCRAHDGGPDQRSLSQLVALGQRLRLPPAGCVALASMFQLTEAVLGRRLVPERPRAGGMSTDEAAVLRLLAAELPVRPGSGTPDIPHGLPGALVWAVLSVRRLCGDLVAGGGGEARYDSCPFESAQAA